MEKKYVTIGIIVILVLGFAFYLFMISPNTTSGFLGSEFNSEVASTEPKASSVVPPFDPSKDRYKGSPTAKNVMIEYSDYQCPACASISPILNEVPTQIEDTVFVYRYFPLIQIHANASISAVAAEAAGAQGKYWEMHDILFEKQTEWEAMQNPVDTFVSYAQTVGVTDLEKFKNEITSKKYLDIVKNGYAEAIGLKLDATPSLFFNGTKIQPANMDGIKQQVQALINK